MPFSDIVLIFRWLIPLWALGWVVLPLSARLFSFLPDKGLATGRITAVVLGSLLCFWLAAVHVVPLSLAPLILIMLPLLAGRGWRDKAFRAGLKRNWRAFLFSDVVFLLAFGGFLWVRLRHPETNDLEKPMDVALISAALRANWLPFENPWLAGQSFTNYYYFGPLMSSLLARTLATSPAYAYNLAQPFFCACFLSATWSLTSALSKSLKVGLLAMLLVGLGGHFEPLRQISQTHQLWPLDWWKTSRVIPNTINEYPAFSLFVGDLHAHFYAFGLAAIHFCVCLGIIKADSARLRSALLLLGGIFIGLFAITNTWDTPFYGLLWLGSAMICRRNGNWTSQNDTAFGGAFLVTPLVALPYFLKFHSQVGGFVFDPWLPDRLSFVLLWGGWWMVGFGALCFDVGEEKPSGEALFRRLLIGVGVLALLFPFVIYIKGAYGGDLRHQDTVFKFGLQAWLLLGVGIASETGFRILMWWRSAKLPMRLALALPVGAYFLLMGLAPLSVANMRAVGYAPRDAQGNFTYSLNAAQFLPPGDQEGIEWLRTHANLGDSVVEAMKEDWDPNYGRVSSLSGVPCILNWPQHVSSWGAYNTEIPARRALLQNVFSPYDSPEALRKLNPTFVFQGFIDPKVPENPQLKPVWKSSDGTTQILRFQP